MLDVTFAAFLLMIGLFLATYFAFQTSSDVIGNIRMRHRMDDAMKIMNETDYLQTFSSTTIGNELAMLMPNNYDYNITIQGYSYDGSFSLEDTVELGSTIPDEKNIVSGRYYFVKIEDNEISRYGLATYKVWLK